METTFLEVNVLASPPLQLVTVHWNVMKYEFCEFRPYVVIEVTFLTLTFISVDAVLDL